MAKEGIEPISHFPRNRYFLHHLYFCLQSMTDQFNRGNKAVSFGDVTVLQFPVVLGNNPAVSAGCPIEIGWEHIAEEIQKLEIYEYMREGQRRSDRKRLVISVLDRAKLLMRAGYSLEEISGAVLIVQELQRQRAESLKGTAGEAFKDLVGKTGKLPMSMVRGVLRLGGLGGKQGVTNASNSVARSA